MDAHPPEYMFAETKRHKPCLIYRGYRYVQDKVQNRTIYWRCEDRAHCNGRAHQLLGNDSLPILTIKHNHAPIIEDLTRHDIVSIDSHRRRRRRRQNQRILTHYSNENNDFVLTTNPMASAIKLENYANKHQRSRQRQHAVPMSKNLHSSEVITTTAAPHMTQQTQIITPRQSTIDPIEMTKLLSNITTNANVLTKKSNVPPSMDYPSRLNQFSWEEIEGRYLPIIFRNENGIYQRYTSKMFVENTIFQSESWQKHLTLARSLPPLVSYTYTDYELKLFRIIIAWHLASFYFKTIPSSDCLIRFEDLLDFYNTLRKLRDNVSSSSSNRPIAPLPASLPPSTPVSKADLQSQSCETPVQTNRTAKAKSDLSPAKESGWVQINNVFVPYIIKVKLRENELAKCPTRQPGPPLQRQFYVPYEILIKCHIFSDGEFAFKKLLIKATQQDFDILNNLITNINIFDEKVPEKTLLVNLSHVMVGLNRILYVKFLPTKQPRSQVNKYHADVLAHKGGTLIMNGNKLIPYIVQNNRFYVPLLYTFHSLPNVLLQAKRGARAPRQYEIDYLNLLFIYFSIDTPPLTSDTLLVDIFNIKCSNLQTPIHFRTLHEHQQHEKSKLLNTIVRCTPAGKTSGSSSTAKSSKCPPANVVVNPMIHHPSFYGLPSPKQLAPPLIKQAELKSITFDHQTFNAIVKSPEQSPSDWKISVKEIFEKLAFDIDYERFIQWCQINSLVPLVKLDDEELKLIKSHCDEDYYLCQRHLDRCVELLKDLKRGSISMTLLPSTSNETQQTMVKSPLAGARKRKTAQPITRHISPAPAENESNSTPQDIEQPLSEVFHVRESTLSVSDEIPQQSPADLATCPAVAESVDSHNDGDDDDIMPVVASVEEEQPIEDSAQSETETAFVMVETELCQDERLSLAGVNQPSCSSGSESTLVLNPIDNTIQESHTDDRDSLSRRFSEMSSSCHETIPSQSPLISPKKIVRKRPRIYCGKSRARSRSLKLRHAKRPRFTDDRENSEEQSSLIVIITSEKIEQHLRTLFMATNDSRRTRTRPVKTPTRLVEEMNGNSTGKLLEADSNVFDILSSPATTDLITANETIDESEHSCTYNVVINNQPNKLGLTIKKVVST